MEALYYKIPFKSKMSGVFLSLVDDNNISWNDYFGFKIKVIPDDLIQQDKFLSWLYKKEKFSAAINYVKANHFYDWHVDTNRGVSINMLLNDVKCHTIFSIDKMGIRLGKLPFNDQQEFYELRYKKDSFYLFNTQVDHMVLNFNKPRYLFSVEFTKDKTKLNYNDMLNMIKDFTTKE